MKDKQNFDNPAVTIIGYEDGLKDSEFDAYVDSITDHIRGKMRSDKEHGAAKPNHMFAQTRFFYVPLFNRKVSGESLSSSLREMGQDEEFCIESPWIQVIRNKNSGVLRADFLWNERQFLIDQVLLDSPNTANLGTGKPMKEQEIDGFIDDYEETVLNVPFGEEKEAALRDVSKRVPAEFVWLMVRAWQTTRGPFQSEIRSAIHELIVKAASGYTNLTKDAIGLCLTKSNNHYLFPNIISFSAHDKVKIDDYDINELR
ncbi:MAG: hypothetical protein COA37_00810 [Hoeflea sp.]|nr:MAG: hypothetical protein COA37_00810 [Hoeflea sp.]